MNEPSMTLLVIGGARSGKSRYAQRLVEESGLAPVFIATAEALDDEMAARIRLHVAMRDARWRAVEAPHHLADAIVAAATPEHAVLVDCLTLWLSNLLLRGEDVEQAGRRLAALVPKFRGPVVFVTNEVGAGIVPNHPLGRSFRDAQGRLNQEMAAACHTVIQVTAGLPLRLKPRSAPTIALRA